MENRDEIMSFLFSYIPQNPGRKTAEKLQRKYNTVAVAQNGKRFFILRTWHTKSGK